MFEINFNPFGDTQIDPNRAFDSSQKTFVITHGFQNTGGNSSNGFQPEAWIQSKAAALRAIEPSANIIIVDWQEGAAPEGDVLSLLQYSTAATNTAELGQTIAARLIELGADPTTTELIGHSLGGRW